MRQFVTSMSAKGYDLYGKTFLEKASECLPGELVVYTEDTVPSGTEHVQWRDLNQVAGYTWFLDGVSRFPAFSGRLGGGPERSYRHDVVTFCRKSFAQIDAATVHRDEMWWIDADVAFYEPIPEEFFAKNLKGVFMAYLGRPQWHSCASLLGFNNKHKQAGIFWAAYMSLYATGTLFALQEWHDSYLVDMLRKEGGLLARNMAAPYDVGDGPANVFDVVLGKYAHHKKGNRKVRENEATEK